MKDIEWQKVVDVKQAVLCTDAICFGFGNYSSELLGRDYSYYGYRYVDGSISRPKGEIIQKYKLIMNDYKKEIPYLFSKIKDICKNYSKFCNKIKNIDFKEKTNKDLADLFWKYFNELAKVMVTLNIPLQIERAVTELIEERLESHPKIKGKPEDIFRSFNALTISSKESDAILEKKALIDLAIKLNKRKDISKGLEEVHKKFTFTYFVFMHGRFRSLKEYSEEVKELAKKEPEKELNKIIAQRKNGLKRLRQAIKELDIKDEFLEIINFARNVIYLRTFRLDRIDEGIFIVYPLFNEIIKRIGIEENLFFELRAEEIIAALDGKLWLDESSIRERKKGYAAIRFNKDVTFCFGKDFEEIKEKEEIITGEGIIKGSTAFPGKVTGKVVIVKSREDLHKVQEGNILVTKMTTPDYIKQIEKSSAIVTEIGGITTHAAIISRELGKPCIMGTKNATTMLKDGDIIEVDANNGTIKKIKKEIKPSPL